MLRQTFGQLVEMVRDECAISSASSRGNDNLAYLQRLIKRQYEFLCDEHDWSFLNIDNDEATKTLQAGERFYDFPTAIGSADRTSKADVFWGNVWIPVIYGITPLDYNSMNPELNQRADPVLKWRIYSDRQFEVFPLPATNGSLFRFRGRKTPEPLVSDTSRADMDDQLIVLYVAAEVLAKQNQKDSDLKLAAAKARLAQMKQGFTGRTRVRMGMGVPETDQRGWPRIRAFPANP